jgi:signal transduction histidine kinase
MKIKMNTIKWRIFKYNLTVIVMLITLATIIFNVAVRIYIEKDAISQLNKIALNTEHTALEHGPDIFPGSDKMPPPPPPLDPKNTSDILRFYFKLDRSLKESLTVLNADYILLDKNKNIATPSPKDSFKPPADLLNQITKEINKSKDSSTPTYLNFYLSGTKYIAIIKPVSDKNSFGLGWIVIYSSLEKVIQLQFGINIILSVILILSALIILIFSSLLSKKISAPFSSLSKHIRAIAERNFDTKIHMPVDDEMREFVNNINIMSEKLETYDNAQKTFLQNVSHEFRTPLMSIQSYAEGIKYDVVDSNTGVNIILDETKRLTNLVEDLLYLSRLDTIKESYHYHNLDFNELITNCIDRLSGIAMKSNIKIINNTPNGNIEMHVDGEKLSRAITNIISNCIRYANTAIVLTTKIVDNNRVQLTISDDGPGFEDNELPNIFERFYKGKKGNFGLGLSISKNVIEKHNGKITAENSESGAVFILELPIS